MGNGIYKTICLKFSGGSNLIERRAAKRFQVDWQILVESDGASGERISNDGTLFNISSSGALLSLTRPLATGANLDVYVKLPLTGPKWMKYPAQVIRVEVGDSAVAAAVRFQTLKPVFGAPPS